MNDCLPGSSAYWHLLEAELRSLVAGYGYSEIRTPIVEKTQLFKRSIGEVTDIVEKEMYTFADLNGDSLTLRPEGTAAVVRAGVEHGLLYNQEQRLWYMGPMFRHERPQKGRYRQFHQVGVETFGLAGPEVDAELILMAARLWQRLGLSDNVRLEINSLGSNEARANYRQALIEFLTPLKDQLDEDSQRRIATNPLRVLDSKSPSTQALLENAPQFGDYLDEESAQHFERLQMLLSNAGVAFVINPRLVRGLDYYNRTVFEWITEDLGAQGTICAGGRYDGLVEQLGGKATPACGFAMGLERIVALLQDRAFLPEAEVNATADVYVVANGDKVTRTAFSMAEQLRDALPKLRIRQDCAGGNFKKQFKRANQSGARVALVLGESEVESSTVSIKFLFEQREQETVANDQLAEFLQQYFVSDNN